MISKLKIGICQRCNRKRPIYQQSKRLCSSCRVLEGLYNHPERYEKLKKQTMEAYHKNPKIKLDYNYKYYRTGDHAKKMKKYARDYYRKNNKLSIIVKNTLKKW